MAEGLMERTDTDVRKTPRWLLEEVSRVWDIGLDAAANVDNRVVVNYLGPDHPSLLQRDGLTADWGFFLGHTPRRVVWCNPPYSRDQIDLWCEKAAYEAIKHGVTTIMLLPGDTSTRWFHRWVLPNRHHFLKRRLKFEGAPLDSKGRQASAKFGSVLVIFEPERSWTK